MAIKILNKDGFIMNNVLGRKVGIVIECASDSVKVPDELGGFIWIDDKSNNVKLIGLLMIKSSIRWKY